MIIATLKPEDPQELVFDIKIEGSKEEPSDIRFVIEAQTVDGQQVQDVFSIICRAVRENDAIKVYVPRLLNLFRAGSYKARLEVVLENRLFIPLNEEVRIEEPITVTVPHSIPPVSEVVETPSISVTLANVITNILKAKEEVSEQIEEQPIEESIPPRKEVPVIDKSWRSEGFKGIKNPFK